MAGKEKTIESIFEEIPNGCNGIVVISDIQRKFYLDSLKYRYDNVLFPIYDKLKNNNYED